MKPFLTALPDKLDILYRSYRRYLVFQTDDQRQRPDENLHTGLDKAG
jgi:hypothetical protein